MTASSQTAPKGRPPKRQPANTKDTPTQATVDTPDERRLDHLPLDALIPATRNPKQHALGLVRASIARFGYVDPAEMDERTGRLVVGHGRLEALRAMRADGEDPPGGIRTSDDGTWLVPVLRGWSSRSDAEAEAYLVVNNQGTIAGGWDDAQLAQVLTDLNDLDPTLLEVAGFDDDQLAELLASLDQGADDDDDDESNDGEGELLGLAGTTVGEPDYTTAAGEVWWMGERHVLVVANPHTQWGMFVPYLEGEAVLLPYPSPMAALVDTPPTLRVVLVQPNTYLAGWLLTKWAKVTGGTPVREEQQ